MRYPCTYCRMARVLDACCPRTEFKFFLQPSPLSSFLPQGADARVGPDDPLPREGGGAGAGGSGWGRAVAMSASSSDSENSDDDLSGSDEEVSWISWFCSLKVRGEGTLHE